MSPIHQMTSSGVMESDDLSSDSKRVVIDTEAPFRSVKDAVLMFGERALAEKIQPAARENPNEEECLWSLAAQLQETKISLETARKENQIMEICLASLKEELEQTKSELKHLKTKKLEESLPVHSEVDVEHLKFVENMIEIQAERNDNAGDANTDVQMITRSISFIDPQSISRVLRNEGEVFDRQFSVNRQAEDQIYMKKMKMKIKKPLVSLFAKVFSKKKGLP